ncbi:MAG: S8 family serine peptidase [Sedimentisphaerales bacterium]|nr:S8 family serine peptidase [Sedimentisphaerales bacterium]
MPSVGKTGKLFIALVSLVISPLVSADMLEIMPFEDFEPAGEIGGPFTPSFKEYELTNISMNQLFWGVDWGENWLEVNPEWGPLDPNESVVVSVSLTSTADTLPADVYNDTLLFSVIGQTENHTRNVTLTVIAPEGILEVTPLDDFEPSGEPGGPFTPASKEYTLTNTGDTSLTWGTAQTESWLDLDQEWGELMPLESVIVTASLNASADLLEEGIYTDTITFTNITGSQDDQTRGVTLTIERLGWIWVSPEEYTLELTEGTQLTESLTIGNDNPGTEDIHYSIRTQQRSSASQSRGTESSQNNTIFPAHDFTQLTDTPYQAGELIVRFAPKQDKSLPTLAEKELILNTLGGATLKHEYTLVPGLSVITLPAGMSVADALETYNQTDGILYAEPNYRVYALATFPNDTRFNDLWGMHNTGQSGGTPDADIDAPEAWDIATGSDEIIVAVIDTGVDYNHVDLAGNMWTNPGEIPGNGQDDDGNGYIDDIYGYDFDHYDPDPMDDRYHGTHCAGTIAGIANNSEGVAGVCWNTRIMALKFLDSSGGGWSEDAIKCVEYATLMGAHVMSNSWGGGSYNQGLKDVIDAAGAAGMLFVAAAGNDYGGNNDLYPHYPSSYTSENIIAVLATNDNDNMANFSNYGPTSVDIGAPGDDILSCDLGGGYRYLDGTSMATPHVTGACALLWSVNPSLSYMEVKDILLRTVDPTLPGKCVSEGRLNLYNAILETNVPWIIVDPEEGTVPPQDSDMVSVTFDAGQLTPGFYEADIMVLSDDPFKPTVIIPVTLTVVPDNLSVSPETHLVSEGTQGGPFLPACMDYTLSNIGTESLNWTSSHTADWITVSPESGLLAPDDSIIMTVCIDPNANILEPDIYTTEVTIQNNDSGSINNRQVTLTVNPPDLFTESFDDNDNDLENTMLTFRPDGSTAYYIACRNTASNFQVDPNQGTPVALGDDDYAEIILGADAEISFYGQHYDRFYIGSNGYLTFGQGDTQYYDSLDNHFSLPRISALFTDLTPVNNQSIFWQQQDDRVVISFIEVPVYGDKNLKNSFQIEIFFTDETVRITWLDLAAPEGIAGLSKGDDLPGIFFESNLSDYLPCCSCGDFNGNTLVNLDDLGWLSASWLTENCQNPHWCSRTDMDRNHITDIGDFLVFANNWLGRAEADLNWTPPDWMVKWTDGNMRPCLSSDRLTMYYYRVKDGIKEIVTAYRNQPSGPFIHEVVNTELGEALTPWVSEDGLRMYFSQVNSSTDIEIKMAQRATYNDPWIITRTFPNLNYPGYKDVTASLTSDELTIFFSSTRPGTPYGWCFWQATRSSTTEDFSNVIPVDELHNILDLPGGPFLMPNGLTLYFASGDDLHKATRASINEPFDFFTKLNGIEHIPDGYDLHPYVTPDEKTLYFYRTWGSDYPERKGIWSTHLKPEPQTSWSEPTLLIDWPIGTPQPHLSSDQLTMYYSRQNTNNGPWEMVEAHRSVPYGPFTSETIITELPGAFSPWVSPDQLRMYYNIFENDELFLRLAERASMSQPWTPVRNLSELQIADYNIHNLSLTEDELRVYWTVDHPDPSPPYLNSKIYEASRLSREETFTNIRELSELNSDIGMANGCADPYVLPDGLTIYYCYLTGLVKASRSSLTEPFGNIETLTDINIQGYLNFHPFVTPDEKTIYFYSNHEEEGKGIWVSHWENTSAQECVPR